MPRFAWVLVVVAVCLVLLIGPGEARAETKKFETSNFELTTPTDGWQFLEISEDDKTAGYVTRLGRRDGDAVALLTIRVVDTQGLSLAELTEEVRQGLRQGMQTVDRVNVGKGNVAGIEGTRVIITGKNQREMPTMFRAYTIEAKGKFHQLIFALTADAPTKLAREVDAIRRGYKLLSGGGEESPEEEEFLAGKPEASEGGGEGGEEGEGPQRDGRTITFPTHNLKWTLPEGSPFEWASITHDETQKEGMLVRAEASIEHPPRKGKEDEGPQVNTALVVLLVEPLKAGWEPGPAVKHPGNQMNWEKNYFDRVEYGRTDTVEELPIGNITGAGLQMVGMKDEHVRFFRWYCASLKGEWYEWRIFFDGDRSVDDDFKQPLKELMKGIEFIDTFEWVRGPVGVYGVPPHNQERGSAHGQEKAVASLGFKAVKPPEMFHVAFKPEETGGYLRLAWEMRSEDRESYLYFDVQSWSIASLRQEKTPEEDRIKQREGQWKEAANSPQTVKRGKTPYFKASFGGAKGLGYEFTGYLDETPYVEEGYVVKYKKHLFWIRFQYGGKDAEKTFKKTVKAIRKGLKFAR